MKKKVILLGAGLIGRAIAVDLNNLYDVTVADVNENALEWLKQNKIKTIKSSASEKNELQKLVKDFDLVVMALPGFMAFNVLKNLIECGKDVVDISFFPENALELDALAKKHNVTAIVDIGVAPGISNLVIGYHAERMKVHRFETLVGGLPVVREFPWEYKAPFSPVDVIEEYTRPARYIENGHLITKPALTDPEYIHFDGIGTLEAFNTDGLRSLLFTMKVPNMIERTLRYPKHIEYIKALKASGFFSDEEIEVNGNKIKPIDFTSKVLINKWKFQPKEEEYTVMRVVVEGEKNGKSQKITYNLLDRYNKATDTSSMARTTGYTCTGAVRLLLEGIYTQKGISPPEFIGKDETCFNFILQHLKERGVDIRKTESK